MPYFNQKGVRLHYLDTGQEGNNAQDSALLFLHEFGGDARSWTEQVAFFSQHPTYRRRCLMPSARGYPLQMRANHTGC